MPQSQGAPIPKWKIALAVGGVVALGGVACWYFRRNRRGLAKPAAKSETKQTGAARTAAPSSKAKQLKEEGNQCFKISDYQKAVEKYSAAAEACGPTENEDLAMIYQNRAAAHEKLQDFESALGDCDRALEANPNYVKALLRRAKIYERMDKMEECFEDLGAVLICDRFENQEALSMYDRVLKMVAERKAAQAIKVVEHAQFSQHRFAQLSAELYRDPLLRDLKQQPEGGDDSEAAVLYRNVLSEINAGHFAEAYALLENLSHLPNCNDTAKLHLARGSLAMTTNRYDEGLSELNWVTECQNCDVEVKVNALVKRAVVEQCTGNTSAAMVSLMEAQQLDESNVDVMFHLALMHLINENLEAGVRMLDECIVAEPDHVAKVKKAMFEYMGSAANGDVTRADAILEDILRYLTAHPGHTDFVELVGQMYCERAEFEKAEALYDKYLRTEDGPQNPTILILKSVLSLQWKQDVKQAESLIESALKLDPQCHLAYEALGLIRLQSGEVVSALEILGKAANCCRSVVELQRILSLRESVRVQDKYARKFNMPLGRGGLGR